MLNSSTVHAKVKVPSLGLFLLFSLATCSHESAPSNGSAPQPPTTTPPTRSIEPGTTPSATPSLSVPTEVPPLSPEAPLPSPSPTPSPSPSPSPSALPSPVIELVYSKGWKQIIMMANYAKTTVDSLGHFATSRTACGLEEYGALELTFWNEFATKMNLLATAEWGTTEQCYEPPHTARASMDGTVEVQFSNELKMVFETKGYEACSFLKDNTLAKDLLLLFNQIVLISDKEGC
ncbi:hypothetical protein WDW86_01650 [Bdellovibrionota bacterium FG-2]